MAIPLRKKNGGKNVKPKQRKGIGRPDLRLEETNRKGDKRSVYGLRGTYAEKFGQVAVTKGKSREGMKLVSWDAIPECSNSCPIIEKCPYSGKNKCTVMKSYVGSAASILHNNFKLDEADLMRVGLHLLPLYRNLCRLQIEEFALVHITRVNKAGNIALHPIYESIKTHVSAIESLWKSLGLMDDKKKRRLNYPGCSHVPEEIPTVGDIVNGNPDYYDSLSE